MSSVLAPQQQLSNIQNNATTAAYEHTEVANERAAVGNGLTALKHSYAKLSTQYTTYKNRCAGVESKYASLKNQYSGLAEKCVALERERDVVYMRLVSLESQHVGCVEVITLRKAVASPGAGGIWTALGSVQTENARLLALLPGSVLSAGMDEGDELQSGAVFERAKAELQKLTSADEKLQSASATWEHERTVLLTANTGLKEECARLQAENVYLLAQKKINGTGGSEIPSQLPAAKGSVAEAEHVRKKSCGRG
ncbi:hypothetical protein B0H19DRAFT_1057918 [Mycena capillaripes]|nr:hypothetical protein B0H19DRAFT_1057918 [Mycena capillaripes]